jgi:5'-phosphate synthase pdxT subunit
MLIGVLALQGGFGAHTRMLRELGVDVREVRVPADLDGLDGLVMPGGESTTMSLGIAREGLAEPLRELVARGTPVLGTCAGLIMLDRDHLGLMDIVARRNAFGRQRRSFEVDLDVDAGEELAAVRRFTHRAGGARDDVIDLMRCGETAELRQHLQRESHGFGRERLAVEAAGAEAHHLLLAVDHLK